MNSSESKGLSVPDTGRLSDLTLDPTLYKPTSEQIEFFKQQTGIDDEEELKEHIITVQKEAWDVVHYMCIRAFGFMRLIISREKSYPELLKLGNERPGAIFLEFACCFGNDARKAIADGYPLENVVTSDVEKPFWELGHRLFRTTPQSFPVAFVPGNVFDPLHIAPREPFYEAPLSPRPNLSTLTSLTPLQGHVSAIHTSAFFHLFQEEDQIKAARALASLLSPLPGSMMFGVHVSQPTSGIRNMKNHRGKDIYCFSPDGWKALWDGVIFKTGTVVVEAELFQIGSEFLPSESFPSGEQENQDFATPKKYMMWSVKRV